MRLPHDAEWEWGWKTPLLLHFTSPIPAPIADFLATPLEHFTLTDAEFSLEKRLKDLKTSRIGIRFERIQEALFRSHPNTVSLQTGLVIPERTEVDLLQRLRTLPETVIHWEIAVKFYLGLDDGGSDSTDRFIGPSLKDTFGIKTRAIFGRQLAVLHDPKVRASHGAKFGIAESDSVISLPKVHGVLYLPFRKMEEVRRPPGVSETGLRGAWTTVSALPEFIRAMQARNPGAKIRWMSERREWITGPSALRVASPLETDLKSFFSSPLESALQTYFAEKSEPIHGTIFDEPSRGAGSDFRFFVVPDNWPDAAERALETLRGESRIKG